MKNKLIKGQVMMSTIIIISSVFAVATALGSLLMVYEIQQVKYADFSTRAIFAADSGIDSVMYCYFYSSPSTVQADKNNKDKQFCSTSNSLADGASYNAYFVYRFDNNDTLLGFTVYSTGVSNDIVRSLQFKFNFY
ncbi:MAG: hypothetical protein ACP5IC_01365 [Minisyncoccia bacterium]